MTKILFICTGNICRSPMAEYLMDKLAAGHGRKDISCSSAGTATFGGEEISLYAEEALRRRGIDASKHLSRAVTLAMLEEADYVIAMTQSHKAQLEPFCEEGKLLAMREIAGEDVPDPWGKGMSDYEDCARQIERALAIFYDKYLSKGGAAVKIPIASDHAAFEAKAAVMEFLKEKGIEPVDMGCYSTESVHYPEYGAKVASAVSGGEYEKGILLCGTGIGMSLVANKFPGVRAALCHNEFTARACREHNDANILVMGARVLSVEEMLAITAIWLETPFAGGRHAQRLAMIEEIEKNNFK